MLGYTTWGANRLCPSHQTSSQLFSHKKTSRASTEATQPHSAALGLGQQMLKHCKNHLLLLLPLPPLLLKTVSSISKKCHLILGLNLSLQVLKSSHVESQHILQTDQHHAVGHITSLFGGRGSCTGHPLLRNDESKIAHRFK